LVLGTGSGIHGHHAKPKYFRRVQCNKIDNIYKFFKKHNPHMSEESIWSANKTDDVICFPIEVSEKAIVKDDLDAIKHLGIILNTQKNWVVHGTSKYNAKPITHNVSCTVKVGNDEWDKVINFIYHNRMHFAAVSLLPETGDKDFKQAPNEKITPKDEEKWNSIISNMKSVDYTKLLESDDNTVLKEEVACAGGACLL
jgi:ribonucleoside-diphosphate reductase alpha chain